MAAICKLWRCPDHREQRCHACPMGGPLNVQYNQTPRADAVALIRRADALLNRWAELYGEHNPEWLPPAGIVNWQEDASQYLAAHTLPTPTVDSGIYERSNGPAMVAEFTRAVTEMVSEQKGAGSSVPAGVEGTKNG